MQQFRRLGRRDAGQGGRHEQKIAFIERRQELAADVEHRIQRGGGEQHGTQQRRLGPGQYCTQQRPVQADEKAVEKNGVFFRDAAANPVAHQHRHQRDRQAGRRRHRVGLGVGQRAEQPALLRFEREHRDERQRDDQQREEQRRPDLGGRCGDHVPACFAGQRFARMPVLPFLNVLVRVLDHHDRRVDHGADGDGNAAERHDVGVDALIAHHDEGEQDAQRQGDHGDQGRAQMEQEEGTHQRDHDELLDQLAATGSRPRAGSSCERS